MEGLVVPSENGDAAAWGFNEDQVSQSHFLILSNLMIVIQIEEIEDEAAIAPTFPVPVLTGIPVPMPVPMPMPMPVPSFTHQIEGVEYTIRAVTPTPAPSPIEEIENQEQGGELEESILLGSYPDLAKLYSPLSEDGVPNRDDGAEMGLSVPEPQAAPMMGMGMGMGMDMPVPHVHRDVGDADGDGDVDAESYEAVASAGQSARSARTAWVVRGSGGLTRGGEEHGEDGEKEEEEEDEATATAPSSMPLPVLSFPVPISIPSIHAAAATVNAEEPSAEVISPAAPAPAETSIIITPPTDTDVDTTTKVDNNTNTGSKTELGSPIHIDISESDVGGASGVVDGEDGRPISGYVVGADDQVRSGSPSVLFAFASPILKCICICAYTRIYTLTPLLRFLPSPSSKLTFIPRYFHLIQAHIRIYFTFLSFSR